MEGQAHSTPVQEELDITLFEVTFSHSGGTVRLPSLRGVPGGIEE